MRSLDVPPSRATPVSPTSFTWETAKNAHLPPQAYVSLPFTAPTLTAMRVRTAYGGGLEMLLSNPAGGRGIYVARWSALRAYASPTLHDIMLADQVGSLGGPDAPLSPASIRAAAIDVAAHGHAGRRLARAAERARNAEQLGQRRLRAHLLLELARSLHLPGSDSVLNDPWSTWPEEHAGWLAGAPRLLAHRLGWPVPWHSSELSVAIARIAQLAWPLGIGPAASQARLPRVLHLMSDAARGAHGMANLPSVIEAHGAKAEAALRQARAQFADPLALLEAWRADSASLTRVLERPDWLLDGWDRLCLLFSDGLEIAPLAQTLLYDGDSRIALSRIEREGVELFGLSGAAASFDRQVRNEHLRLHELHMHDPETHDSELGNPDG